MGISLGVHSSKVKSCDGIEKCVPVQPLKKFPCQRSSNPGDLLEEIKALPRKCYIGEEPENAYWWVDAQFRPGDNTTLFVTCGCFTPRSNSAWLPAKRMPSGRIFKYALESRIIKREMFGGSCMSGYPKIHPHPSGQYVGYIGVGAITVETVQHELVLEKYKDLRNCNYKYFAFAPNGKYAAILLSACRRFEIMISRLDRGFSSEDTSVDFYRLYNGFKGSTAYNEHLECKWSPDSSHIAVCTSIGYLVVLDTALQPVVNVFEDILTTDRFPSCAGAFDYDPRSCRQILAFGTNDRHVFIVNIESRKILYESEVLSPDPIDCLHYSPKGELMGISFRNWTVLFVETCKFEAVLKLNIAESTTVNLANIPGTSSPFPTVMRLSFTSTGEQVVTSSCDGYVRIWQLPRSATFSLKDLCRQAILSWVPMPDLRDLTLPKRIVDYLVSMPTMA